MTSFWVLLDAALRGEERSARWLAEKIGVDGSTVARWRKGSGAPDPDQLALIETIWNPES